MDDIWKRFAADFNAMTDEEVEETRVEAQETVDHEQEWLDAVASWEAAGRPRTPKDSGEGVS